MVFCRHNDMKLLKIKRLLSITLSVYVFFAWTAYGIPQNHTRLIVTTDLGGSDPDDIQSMIHLLVCADRIDIEGLISTQAWVNDPDKTQALKTTVDHFIEVLPNLQKHSFGYPSADYLKSIIATGQSLAHMDGVGEGKDSSGSELIVSAILKEHERPLWIAAWGGLNTVAQALWKLQHNVSAEQFDNYLSRIRIYDVLGQDDAGAYIAKNYPNLLYIRNTQIYGWAPDDAWTQDNIQSRFPLGNYYPDRIWATEGDSPSFLYMYANGLNVPEPPEYGGWGGRFSIEKQKNIRGMDFIEKSGKNESDFDDYYMIVCAPEGVQAIKRWEQHIHNDFAARMIWCCESLFSNANHHPYVVVNGNSDLTPLYMEVKAEEKLSLCALGFSDPDNDQLTYEWSVYREASDYTGEIYIENANSPQCTVFIPYTPAGSEIHIVLEVTDSGSPQLTSYRRVILRSV